MTEQRTRVDFVHQMRWLVDQAYPEAVKLKGALPCRNVSIYLMSEMVSPTGNESCCGVSANFRRKTVTGRFQRADSTEVWLSMSL